MKKAQFFIDDVIWLMGDLTKERPKSLFSHPFLALLKEANERYGVKTQLNLFFTTPSLHGGAPFDLTQMTDEYKDEWHSVSSWLKLAFHARAELPRYPYINVSYEEAKNDFKAVTNEIKRFAGEDSLAKGIVPHWAPISYEGIRALAEGGIKITYATWGEKHMPKEDLSDVPSVDLDRFLLNRTEDTMLFTRTYANRSSPNSLCSYNHMTTEQRNAIHDNLSTIKDERTGMAFKNSCHIVLNSTPLDALEGDLNKLVGQEYICIGNHEQYFHSDYFNYQPDYSEKLLTMGRILSKAGYEFIFMEDMV